MSRLAPGCTDMAELDDKILQIIRANPGRKAKDIAQTLGVERKSVNAALYGPLRSKVKQDKAYRWHPKDAPGVEARDEVPKALDTPLARLSKYYLDCLSHDDLGGVSEFAASKYGDPKYVEIQTLPMFDDEGVDPLDTDGGRRLLGRIRRDRNRQTLFLGYPTRLNRIRSRKGWEGLMVEPIFLFSYQDVSNTHGWPTLSEELPQINFRALRALSNAGDTNLIEEAIQIADELGLDNTTNEQPDFDELIARLSDIRPDWDWREGIDPYALSDGGPLADIEDQGIYNRAILIAAERSPYTKGLETELGQLQTVDEGTYQSTALGTWLSQNEAAAPTIDQQPLLEVVPLNTEQRQAVRQALSNELTVITGPPGTGKSQVVTSILVNAAWQQQAVLFASKNNKAVDVVETRVNGLGSRPVLLRLGANEYQNRLAQYLISLLAARSTDEDRLAYEEAEEKHKRIEERSHALTKQLDDLVALRNQVDRLEQHCEPLRGEAGEQIFRSFKDIDLGKLSQQTKLLRGAIKRADKTQQGLLTRLAWPAIRKARFERLRRLGGSFSKGSSRIGLRLPEVTQNDGSTKEWVEYGKALGDRIGEIEEAQEYFSALQDLSKATPLESLSHQWQGLAHELAQNSEQLWQAWLRLQPSRLSADERKLLGDYSALLQMIVSANEENQTLGRDVFRRYYQLFPKIVSILSCWAVTSLSARGRVPFEPNFFDLLVIDEASQCDIASVLPLLFRTRRVVVIGDPMQLRHISTLSKQQDQQLLGKHGLIDDYPGWAYSTRSLFDLASSLCKSEDIVSLRDHHRSHADIIGFSNREFYENKLRVATNYQYLKRPRTDEPAVRWVNVRGRVVRPGTGGAVNEEEARAVVDEVERLLSQGYRGSIGVVSPFRAQANRIRDLAYQDDRLTAKISETDFLADTVHKFQGDERDVMIFSPVVSSGMPAGGLGFLRSNPNLFNVAITRARAALIVVGDRAAALACDVTYLADFAGYVDDLQKSEGQAAEARPKELGPRYPTVANPDQVSDWERQFYEVLYQNGIKAMPQYPVEKYVLDFAILAGDRRLNVEIDGERYHRNWDGELCRRDQIRNQRLMELGWDVMRFWVYQIRDDGPACVQRVEKWLAQSRS